MKRRQTIESIEMSTYVYLIKTDDRSSDLAEITVKYIDRSPISSNATLLFQLLRSYFQQGFFCEIYAFRSRSRAALPQRSLTFCKRGGGDFEPLRAAST